MDADRWIIRGVITSEKNPGDPKDDTSARHIKVLVLQASSTPTERIYYTRAFPAVNTRGEPLLPSPPEDVKAVHKYYQSYQPRNAILPNVRYNAETLQGHWSDDAWAHRAIYDLGDYHILHAPSSDKKMFQNWFRPDLFQGDIFILKVSPTRSCDGPCIYENILLNANPYAETAFMKVLDDLMKLKGEL